MHGRRDRWSSMPARRASSSRSSRERRRARARAVARPGRGRSTPRRASSPRMRDGDDRRASMRGARARSSATTARSTISSASCASKLRRPPAGRRRPSRRARRRSSSPRRCGSTRAVLVDAREVRAAGAAAPAAQPGADPRAARALRPTLPQVACFDTAFHRTQPDARAGVRAAAGRSPTRGVRRYGFHGLSYEYIAARAAASSTRAAARGRTVVAASRQRRQHVRDARRAAASRARWASPPSTACRWARAAARSIPA